MSAVHATQLQVSTQGLILPNGLRIASVNVVLPMPVVQINPFFLPEGTTVDLDAVIEAPDIEAYLNKRQPSGMTNFSVKAENGALTVVAIAKVIVSVQVGAEGTLEFSAGKLIFVPKRAEVGGVRMPDGMMRDQLNKVNPIIDTTGYPIEATVKSIKIGDGVVKLSGRTVVTAPIPRREP